MLLSNLGWQYRRKVEAWDGAELKTFEIYVSPDEEEHAAELLKFMYTEQVSFTKGKFGIPLGSHGN